MTVQSEIGYSQYTLTSVLTPLPVTFRFLEDSDLKVMFTPLATGVPVELVLNSQYTALGARTQGGGTVTLLIPTVAGDKVYIDRGNMNRTQLIDYRANDPFPEEDAEDGLDRLTMLVQQQVSVTDRAIVLPIGVIGVSTELPPPEALKLLRWKPDMSGLENATPPEIATVAPGAVVDATVSPIAGIQSSKLSYLQAGTGAVNQLVQSRLRNEVWAEDFGAVADYNEGTNTGTDNTAAFNRALVYLASAGGGTLKLGRGAYMGRIQIVASNIKVVGQGSWATKLFNAGNLAAFEIDCTSTDIQYSGLHGVLIQNRDKAVYTSADGIYLNAPTSAHGSSFLTFEDVYVFRMRHNIHMKGRTIWNTWKDIRVAEAINNGLNIDAYDNAAQQTWINCRFAVSAQHGIFLSHTFAGFPTVGWTFIGCTFERNLLNGIRLTGTVSGPQAWKFINCYCEENTQNISIGGSGGLQKAHVFCDCPDALGISFDGGSMFGESPGDPAMDYHIYVNGTGSYFGDVRNMRFGIATVLDVYWPKNVVLGKNLYTSGNNADPNQGSFITDAFSQASTAFTPSITFGGGGVGMTYSNRKGQYVRHGNMVHFTIYVALTAKGSSTGTAVLSGLPITSVNVANLYHSCAVQADQLAAGVAHVQARIVPNTGNIELTKFAGGVATLMADTDLGNFTSLTITGSYLVR